MEYYEYFRLKGPPFQPASPDGAVYFSPTHLQGLATLESGLTGQLSGLTLLTGEAGIGKTTLIYSLLQRDYKRVRVAHIDDPKLSFLDMMRAILTQLNLYSSGTTKLDYLKALDHLLELHGKEERIAIVVDEAQVLSDDILEELRLLSNRGQRSDRCLLQLILVGQPELAERLKKPELRQLNQRISTRGVLKPLNTAEAIMYVECRLSVQGGSRSGIFESGALKHLLRRSDGIPRKINMLCHSAMLAAFYAGERKVSSSTAKKVAAEYHDAVSIVNRTSGRPLVISAIVGGAALASLSLWGFVHPNAWSDWLLNHTASFGEAIERTIRPAKAATQLKAADQQNVKGNPHTGVKTKAAATSLAAHPVEASASLVPGAAPAIPKDDVAVAATAPKGSAPAAATISATNGKQTIAPETSERRGQIAVRDGDTLEKIADRYFGSKAGIDQLIEANPQLTNINQLTVGQIIYLPPGIAPKALDDQAGAAPQLPNVENSSER